MISAILLAAGSARRMGENKLLLPLGNQTILEHSLSALLHSKANETIVVIGHEADRLKPILLRHKVRWVENKDYTQGMSTSLKVGLRSLHPKSQAVLIALADQPCVRPEDINQLIETYRHTGKTIVAPSFEGRRGNPVLFDLSTHKKAMEQITGDRGCREILRTHPEALCLVPMTEEGTLRDIDTPHDYETLVTKDPQ